MFRLTVLLSLISSWMFVWDVWSGGTVAYQASQPAALRITAAGNGNGNGNGGAGNGNGNGGNGNGRCKPVADVELSCDGRDDDCDGIVDEQVKLDFYRDADGDGFGIDGDVVSACVPPAGYSAVPMDCDDSLPQAYPGGLETCDGVDNDCNGYPDDLPACSESLRSFSEQYLVDMSAELGATSSTADAGETLWQTFQLASSYPVAGTVSVERLFLWFDPGLGSAFDLDLLIRDSQGQVVHSQKLQNWTSDIGHYDEETGFETPPGARLITFGTPVDMQLGADYRLELTVNQAELPLSVRDAAEDYPHGQSSSGRDIWFKLQGTADLRRFALHQSAPGPAHQLLFDPGWDIPVAGQVVGLGGAPEQLSITKLADPSKYSYELEDPNVASLDVARAPAVDTLSLTGVAEGETLLRVRYAGQVVEAIRVWVFAPRTLDISYTYVAYPGESEHALKSQYATVSEWIRQVYAPINVNLNFTDQGVVTHEWDFNGDGQSFTSDRLEMWSPLDQGAIPNAASYFANLFVLRDNKDDAFHGASNGGGTSRRNPLPAGGLVRIHLFRSPASIADTLAHELAHNFGLTHYSSANLNAFDVENEWLNLMKVGRQEANIFGFQARQIHQTLREQGL